MYFRLVLHTDVIYTHFMYVPIALACWWWGRKGMLVAAGLGAAVAGFHLFGLGSGTLWNDAARVGAFGLVSFSIGTLRERGLADGLALKRAERRYRLLLEEAMMGILVCREHRVLFVNEHLCAMIGATRGELAGRRLEDLVAPDDAWAIRELGSPESGCELSEERREIRLRRPGGGLLWVEVSGCRTEFEDREAVLLNLYDIAARKEAEAKRLELAELARRQEEQLEHSTRLAELGEMAAAISHELNQPLTGIRNYARNAFYMIDQGVGSEDEIKGNLRLIADQVDRAAKIINEMRELTRRSEMHFTRLEVNAIVRESVEFLLPQMKLSGVEVELALTPDLPDIWGDRIRLAQVFLNLLNNARQAMEDSNLRRLYIRSVDDPNGRLLKVEVRDTGKGFSEQEGRNLFVPFFTTKKTGHGTGLGLSISKGIIKDHGGAIEASGSPGEGATFTVVLPVAQEEEAPGK